MVSVETKEQFLVFFSGTQPSFSAQTGRLCRSLAGRRPRLGQSTAQLGVENVEAVSRSCKVAWASACYPHQPGQGKASVSAAVQVATLFSLA